MRSMTTVRILAVALALAGGAVPAAAGEWPSWRGPANDGVSAETGLISSWSKAGENLLWRRTSPGARRRWSWTAGCTSTAGWARAIAESVGGFDAETGKPIWERRFNLYLTTVPFNRVGWAAPTGDPETGYIYDQVVSGLFVCLDRDGKTVWSHSLKEQYGRGEGYGGRTASPLIDEDRVDREHDRLELGAAGSAAPSLLRVRQAHRRADLDLDAEPGALRHEHASRARWPR